MMQEVMNTSEQQRPEKRGVFAIEEDVIKALKAGGPDDPIYFQAMEVWASIAEQKRKRHQDNRRVDIWIQMRTARLYARAGYYREAIGTLESAYKQANYGNYDDLMTRISRQLGYYDEKSGN